MPAFWLTYKPLSTSSPRGWPAAEMTKLVRCFDTDPVKATPLWRIASHKFAKVGDRVYLFKQGSGGRGIFGVGEIMESPREQVDETEPNDGPKPRAKIRFDKLVDPDREFLLDLDAILDIVPDELVTAFASGNRVPENVTSELEKRLSPFLQAVLPITFEQAADPCFDPDSVHDERERALRAIRLRRGQPAFRSELLTAYGNRCAITGCGIKDVLEAAHITPYLAGMTNDVSNGLLLRADIHTLFDCWLRRRARSSHHRHHQIAARINLRQTGR